MHYEEIRRVIVDPFWTEQPLVWKGIADYAHDGRVGMFNLAWLMLNTM